MYKKNYNLDILDGLRPLSLPECTIQQLRDIHLSTAI